MGCQTCAERARARRARSRAARDDRVAYVVVSAETGECILTRGGVCRSFVDTTSAETAARSEVGPDGWSVLPATVS